jgi:nicotinamidase-related amidase
MRIDRKTALLVVDVQNDFCPGGAVPVPEGDRVVPVLNSYIDLFMERGAQVFFTRDWHPKNHMSFKERGGQWPPHCVQETEGAAFHKDLEVPSAATIISKADRPDSEAYSGFSGTDLAAGLRDLGVDKVLVGGLATDYCVKNTVLDAVKEGFETYHLKDASRGVEASPGDTEKAVEEMKAAGARELELKDLKE